MLTEFGNKKRKTLIDTDGKIDIKIGAALPFWQDE